MKKLLSSWGLVLALLSLTISPTRAQGHLQIPATVPASLYKISSHAGTFVDISTNPNAVALGTDLEDGTDLLNYFFEPTSESDNTPVSKKVTATPTKTSTKSEFCFPLNFDFKISGRTMRYFLVSALGGAYFSPEPTRTPTSSAPSGSYTGNCIHVNLWTYSLASYAGATPSLSKNATGKIKKVTDKAPAYYLIEGTDGNHVLTTQHHVLLLDGDEWIYQLKFYEGTNNFEFVVGNFETDAVLQQAVASSTSFYGLDFGLFESYTSVTGADAVNDTINTAVFDARPWQLGIATAPSGGQHKWYASRFYGTEDNGWNNPGPMTSGTASKALQVTPDSKPEAGRTVRFNYPECQKPLPAFPESDYSVVKTNNDASFTAKISYKNEAIMANGLINITDMGTIVAISSASNEPDFTLENGTFYFKGHQFPEANGFTPTVLCNQMPTLALSGTPPAATMGITTNTAVTAQLTDLDKLTSRYIHVYRMSLNCDGLPVYSPLCFTIAREPILDPPVLLETVGKPTVNSVKLHAKPADGESALIVKSNRSINISPKGQLKVGDKIGTDAEVVKILSAEETWDQSLQAGEGCYFVAITVNTSDPDKYVYSPVGRLWCPARAAYNGLPGLLDMSQEICAIPNKEYEGMNIKSQEWRDIEPNTYRDLPFGWTREIEINNGAKDRALGLGQPGYDGRRAISLWAKDKGSSDAITPPILLNKKNIVATYTVQWFLADNEGGTSITSAPNNDTYTIQYAIGDGDGEWQTIESYKGNALPTPDKDGNYPLACELMLDESQIGQYIRFRYIYEPASNSGATVYHAVLSVDIKELKTCKTQTLVTTVDAQTTSNAIGLTWTDPNTTPAPSYKVAYKQANTENDWTIQTVNTNNATLTGLRVNTAYMVNVTAVCGNDDESEPTETATFSTIRKFPYRESMAQRDTSIMVQGTRALVTLYSPFPGANAFPQITRRDGGVQTYTGTLPAAGNASLTMLTENERLYNGWSPYNTYSYVVENVKTPQSVGIRESATNQGWLLTPFIHVTDLEEDLPQVVRFTAKSAASTDTGRNWSVGNIGEAFATATLQVLVSNTGNFTQNDVIGTVNVGTMHINDTAFEFELPTAKEGRVQVAFYFNNPKATTNENNPNFMLFEIYDVKFEYTHELCPELEGLESSSLTTDGVTYSWTDNGSAYYEFSWGPVDAEGYTDTVKVEEATYTITGLEDNKAYKVLLVGFCDEDGSVQSPNTLTDTFTTLEACHTPTEFTVTDVTYYGATFSSVNEQAIMLKREVKVVTEDETHTHYFDQMENTLVVTDELSDNMNYTAQTRSICVNDTSAWSAAITFSTPMDPVPDTFAVVLNILPEESTGEVTGAGRYEKGEIVTLTATAAEGYEFYRWVDMDKNNEVVSKTNPYRFTINKDVHYAAEFREKGAPVETYTVTLNVLPNPNAGEVTGAGSYEEGETVTITASAAEGYTFEQWQDEAGQMLSTDATYTFKATADVTYTALFKQNTANEKQRKAAFNVGAGNGHLYIENLNNLLVKEVTVFNTVGRQLAHFTPNSNANLTLPVNTRFSVLVVRVVSEQGAAVYKVYLH